MAGYNCHCGACGGKAVSRSTFFDHRPRRIQENIEALQPDVPNLEEYVEDIDMADMGELFHD